MSEFELRGVKISFPFKPYDIQKNYMEKVIECLQTESNGVLESPTGTGKTLSLLCSSLAWLTNQKENLRKVIIESSSKSEDNPLPTTELKSMWDISKIIYASRTHSQLTQAMQELKRTKYAHLRATIIGSRDQMCIHPDVMSQTNNSIKIHMCKQMVKVRQCPFHNRVDKMTADPSIMEMPIADIEDLLDLGKKRKFCPYYMTKELKKHADIIFLPYNYLLDPRARKANQLDLKNSVIILDEAHNVEKVCENSASFELKSTDIALCIEEVTDIMKKVEEDAKYGLDDGEKDFSMEDLEMLKILLLKLEEALDNIPLPKNNEGVTFDGKYIFEILKNGGIDDSNQGLIAALLEKLIEYLSANAKENPFQRSGAGIQLIQDLLLLIFQSKTEEFKERINKCYRVHLTVEDDKKKKNKAEGWFSKNTPASKSACRVLSYWCFSPNFGMRMLLEQGVRCVILTSGTLAPLKPLISELGINVGVQLENPHVVDGSQISIRIISAGPDGTQLNSGFQNRDNEKYIKSLGLTIINVGRQIPHGLLIFFPSYVMLSKCQESWQQSGIWTCMNGIKTVYVEPKTKDAFTTVMQEFYAKVKNPEYKGAIFMAVCRGKVSEGLDFADINGRGVIITGLPYPPFKDPRVILKKRYLDSCKSKNSEYVSGQEWYGLEATRAVNQAIGRVIRHRNDYGAIILLDNRFNNLHVQNQLSLWVRVHIKPHLNNYKQVIRDMKTFFEDADKKISIKIGEEKNKLQNTAQDNKLLNGEVKIYKNDNVEIKEETFRKSACCSSKENNCVDVKDENKRVQNPLINPNKRRKILVTNFSKPSSLDNENNIESVADENKKYIEMIRSSNLDKPGYKLLIDTMAQYKRDKNIEELIKNLKNIFQPRPHLRYLVERFVVYVQDGDKEKFKKYLTQMK